MENIDLATKLDLFSTIWITLRCQLGRMVVMKVNKYISANLSTHLIYDDDIMIKQDDGSAGQDPVQRSLWSRAYHKFKVRSFSCAGQRAGYPTGLCLDDEPMKRIGLLSDTHGSLLV